MTVSSWLEHGTLVRGHGNMMRRTDTAADVAVTIVGGGVHGTHLAVQLLQAELIDPCDLRIVDPSGLLESFRRKCHQCGMVEL